jgi:phosphatidyl-myo-inositol dimannoside synthase
MRLLVITNDFGPRQGGIESFVHALLDRLPHGSFLVYTNHQTESAEFDRQFTARTGALVIRDRSRVLLPTMRVRRHAARLVREHEVSAVWFGSAAPLALMTARLRRAGASTIVATTHGHEVWWAKLPLMRTAIRAIGANVDVLTYLGEFTRNALAKAMNNRDLPKLQRLAPGVDLEHFKERDGDIIRQRHGLGTDPVIACISRLVHRKGQDRLIEALPIILRSLPRTRLLLVGQGPRRKHLEALARRLDVADSVTFAGAVPYAELPAYYSAGTIFAMPTRTRLGGLEVEGLGMVYLEASACGRAVIAGRSGGSPDAVLHGKTGELVDDNPAHIAEVALTLLTDQARRREMGSAGRAWVENEWDWSMVADRFTAMVAAQS